jgi:AraC-like DNA-binding protein
MIMVITTEGLRRLLREKYGQDVPLMTPTISENTPEKAFLDKAMGVLEEHYSSWEFTLDDFARALNLSRRTLHRKLKAITDRAPAGFLNEFRMVKAAELLMSTSETVAEIRFLGGYDESANFSRVFKKYHQMTPSEYRAAN